ncbi:MAG: acyltransferase [Oscillospiraceae bacterium]|jgi:peptidoglycan/LPS O-acetylase OafA/YrhL|nr:acyltransferase [Oscillospiraceae bacterium]
MLKSKQIQGLDSLRALGVILVLIYHLFPTILPGGFLGVDIFFAFSGYLITALLMQEFREKRGIALADFYRRRVKRLLPAMVGMLGVTLPLSLLISPDFRVGIRRQAAAALGFVTNYFEIAGGKSYEDAQLPHLFVHTWTLAVEMHFYLFWAAIIALVFWALRKKSLGGALLRARRSLTTVAAIVASASFVLMQWLTRGVADGADSSAGYFATHAHFFPIMLGALTALHFGYRTHPKWEKFAATKTCRALCYGILVTGTAGLVTLSLLLTFSSAATYRWGMLVASLTVCAMIISVRLLQETKALKESKILVWLGARSFGIYLYHWPVLIVFQQLLQSASAQWLQEAAVWLAPVLTLLVTLPLAELSFRVLETRFRGRKAQSTIAADLQEPAPRKPLPYRTLAAALAAVALVLLSGTALVKSPPITSLELVLAQERRANESEAMGQLDEQLAALTPVNIAQTAPTKPADKPTFIESDNKKKYAGGVTMVGDSVMLGASSALKNSISGVKVDAKVSRFMKGGEELIADYLKEGKLSKNLVIGLATNVNGKSDDYLRSILDSLKGKGIRVVIVTGYGGTGATLKGILAFAEEARKIQKDYDFVVVADWSKFAAGHLNLLSNDRIHLKNASKTAESCKAYVKIITDALDAVQKKPAS